MSSSSSWAHGKPTPASSCFNSSSSTSSQRHSPHHDAYYHDDDEHHHHHDSRSDERDELLPGKSESRGHGAEEECFELDEIASGDRGRLDGEDHELLERRTTTTRSQKYTRAEEEAVVKKFDKKLVLFLAVLYLVSFLDRSSEFSLAPFITFPPACPSTTTKPRPTSTCPGMLVNLSHHDIPTNN